MPLSTTRTLLPLVLLFLTVIRHASAFAVINVDRRGRASFSVTTVSSSTKLRSALTTPPSLEDRRPEDRKTKYWWQKGHPKSSLALLDVPQSHTAKAWILNVIDVAHWIIVVPSFLASYAVMLHVDAWCTFFEQDVLRTFCLCASPLILIAAYMAPVIMHMYEDWQVAPSQPQEKESLPASVSASAPPPALSMESEPGYNNLRLRQVAQNVLFGILAVAALMNHHALSGWQMAPLSMVMVAMACLGDQNQLASQYIPAKTWFNTNESLVPVPITTMILFVYANILQTVSYWNFATSHLQAAVVTAGGDASMATATTLLMTQTAFALSFPLIGLGGAYEGLVTEAHFNQWDHLRGVLVMHVGFFVQVWALFQIGTTVSLV